MPRVIAGTAGGRPLRVRRGDTTRPTSDRVKEALFSTLGDLAGAVVLDLYAGSGGLGIEALSRGAAHAVFVEQDRRTAAVLRDNLATAGVAGAASVVVAPAATFCAAPAGGPFDVVLADPPYAEPLDRLTGELADLVAAGALADGAVVVLERDRHRPEPVPDLLTHDADRTYGDTVLRYLRHQPTTSADHEGASPR